MLKKKLTKYLWFGSDVDSKNNPITPQPAPEGEPLDGLNEGELYIHNNSKNPTLYTLSSDGKVVPIGGNTDVLDKRYLRKDKDDRSVGKISSDKGFEAGTYVKGLVGGSGAWIGADGYGEMSGLTLREFLEVPELRFNRVDVVSGELWNAVAFGLVEEVAITGEETGILKIKLEENERCGLHVGDFCRGIFADFGDGSNWEGPDECNFLHLYGFWTSYFTPKTIIENKEGLFVCEYALKPKTKQHPTKSMKFAVYGNPTDTTRQASAYATRTYKRYLNNVDTWVIEPDRHIYAQYGDLNGLVIDGVDMKGYGSYQSNAYFKGVQIQLSPEQLESLKGDSAYSAQLTNNVGTIRLDKDGNMAEGLYEESIVTAIKDGEEAEVTAKDENGQESSVTVTNHKLTTTVQAYKGNVPLFYSSSATSGSFSISLTCVGCTAFVVNGSVIVSSITSTKDCRVNVTVNCEGMAVYNLVYNVVFVQDGQDGAKGEDGKKGKDAVLYRIEPNIQTISKTMTGSLEPETVTFKLQANNGGIIQYYPTMWSLYGKVSENSEWEKIKSSDSTTSFNVTFSDKYKYYELNGKTYGSGDTQLGDSINITVVSDGENGASGAMARYRGEFVFYNDEPYVYDSEYRDIVIYEGNVYQVYAFGSSVTEAPTVSGDSDNDGKWQRANKFRFVAMDTALIDSANIGGFMFKRNKYIDGMPVGKLESQYGPIVITDIAYNTSRTAEAMMSIVCDGNAYTESTTIVKMKNGIVHSLQPSVKYIRMDKDGAYVDAYISCGLMYSQTLPTGYTLKYSKDSDTESVYTLGDSILTHSIRNVITFSMYDSNNILVERQHVYVLKEGSSTVRFVYDNYVQVACNEDNSIKSGLPIRFNIVAYKGWDEVPITSMSVSGSGLTVDNDRIELDAETGTFKCSNVNLSGVINATGGIFKNIDVVSGTIGGLTISENSISSAKGKKGMKIQGESILFDFSGTEFIRINSSLPEKTLFYGRMDDGVLMELNAYGAGATALNILCNSSGIGKAINSVGENFFISRYASSSTNMEQTMIAGLSLSCKNGTTFSAPSNVSNNTSAWVDFLVATGNFELPNANSCPGKILFVKFTGNYTVESSSYIVSAADNSTDTSRTRDKKAMFYISNGVNWYEFYCG